MDIPFEFHNWWYLILSLVGLIVTISALRSRRQAGESQAWPGTQGRVIESRLNKRETTDGEGKETTAYAAVVRYTYSVTGKEYTGDRIAFGVKPLNRNSAAEIVNRYSVDRPVMVYYDPKKPQQAVLERASGSGWLQILIGIVLVAVGIYFAIG